MVLTIVFSNDLNKNVFLKKSVIGNIAPFTNKKLKKAI